MLDELIPYQVCPICNSQRFEPKVRADCSSHKLYKEPLSPIMVWVQCLDCGHVFREGFFSEAAFEILFQDSQSCQQVGDNFENQRLISARMVEKILPFRRDGIWLDVGFGNGSLLCTAAEYGFQPLGLDLRQKNVDDLNVLGIPAYNTDFVTADLAPNKASVISMCDVLEHMQFPVSALESAYRNLDEGGILLLSMPNLDCFVWKILDMGGANPYWAEIEHFHNFGRTSLYTILDQCGFSQFQYGVSERYRACMEIVAVKKSLIPSR